MNDLSKRDVEDLKKDVVQTVQVLDLPNKKLQLDELKKGSLESNFWENQENAKMIMAKIAYIQDEIDTIERIKKDIDSLEELFFAIEKETQQNDLIDEYLKLKEELEKFSLRRFLSGEYDQYPTLMTIYAGQGGTEANDWANMLFRMYTMYFDKQNWNYNIIEMLKGSEVGISTVTIQINQPLSFGMLKKEQGVHRLVRISPYNSQGLRQTTFAGVEVLPLFEKEEVKIEIADKDIDFKAVKASGPGGQKVNKTSSAVQITHIPTGITVNSSTQRSQAQNRESAMNILKAKLWRIKEDEKLKEISDIRGDYKIASWGNQIRNYVLHPYKMVKDLRTNVESSNPESVLDGNLDEFVEAEIRMG